MAMERANALAASVRNQLSACRYAPIGLQHTEETKHFAPNNCCMFVASHFRGGMVPFFTRTEQEQQP